MFIDNKKPVIIAGPCAIESQEQIYEIAKELSKFGIKYLRGGAFKPRTSPDSFQGIGGIGFEYIRKAADEYDMKVVSEVLDNYQLDKYIDMIDIIQIGSKNMTSTGLLKYIGKKTAEAKKTVLLKRGFNSTLREFLFAAEYILNEGNRDIILCLRGIRTFEQIDSELRNTPDLCSILELRESMTEFKLPIFFDPSHATGNSKYVIDVAKTALFLGADGLLIECHNNPKEALSDGKQAILPKELKVLFNYIRLNYE
jgi:3-deoxy-7-phosphoheptulonate synthase